MSGASGNISILQLTVALAADVPANRFIDQDGTLPAAGGKAFGVTRWDGKTGELMTVDVMGTTIAECGAAVAFDADLMVDAAGKVVTLSGAGKRPVARAMEAGTGDGSKIEILLLPTGGPVTAA